MKTIKTIFLIWIGLILCMSPIQAAGENKVSLNFYYDATSRQFQPFILQSVGTRPAEDRYSMLNSRSASFFLDNRLEAYGLMSSSPFSKIAHPYTFPEFHDVSGNHIDEALAIKVGHALVENLNIAMKHILEPVSKQGLREMQLDVDWEFLRLAAALNNSAHNALAQKTTGKIVHGKLEWTIGPITDAEFKNVYGEMKGAVKEDYVKLVNYKKRAIIIPYVIPKGYSEGQESHGRYTTSHSLDDITPRLSWGHVIILAHQKTVGGTPKEEFLDTQAMDLLSGIMSGFFDSIANLVMNTLGLSSTKELFFNKGNRSDYYYGLFSMSWLQPINTLYFAASALAIIFILISIATKLIKRNVASIVELRESSLPEAIKDWTIMVLGIALFMPILTIILSANISLVDSLYALSPTKGHVLGLGGNSAAVGIGPSLINIAYVFILIALNLSYFIRGIMLAMLIGLSPFFISCYGLGKPGKSITTIWFKEIIGNIFMQSFNGLILFFYVAMGSQINMPLIVQFTMLISFIPLNKFFKETLMGLKSTGQAVSDNVSGIASSLAITTALGGAKALAGSEDSKPSKKVQKEASSLTLHHHVHQTKGPDKEALRGSLGAEKAFKDSAVIGAQGAKMLVAMGISVGSAGTGGSIMAGKGAILDGGNSIMKQLNGKNDSDEEPITAQGWEMNETGFKGFASDDETLMLSWDALSEVNHSDWSRQQFMNDIKNYDENIEVVRYKNTEDVMGVKIPGVQGHTTFSSTGGEDNAFSETHLKGRQQLHDFHTRVMKKHIKR